MGFKVRELVFRICMLDQPKRNISRQCTIPVLCFDAAQVN